MASSAWLTLLVPCLLLWLHVEGLSTFTDDAQNGRQHGQHDSLVRSEAGAAKVVMDAGGTMSLKSQRHHGVHQSDTDPAVVQATYPFYHTSDELHSEVVRLSKACNGMLTFKTVNDTDVSLDVITVRKAGVKSLNKVFMLFGEHARELISPESGMYFLKALCGDTKLSAAFLETGHLANVLDKSEFQIVLNANPRSRKKVEGGEYCTRTNPSGVDLNRNWDEHFEQDSAGFGSDSNPGPKPFSEPETRMLKQVVTDYAPTTFLTVHSGTRGMYIPWAYDMTHLATFNEPGMMEILKSVDNDHCQCPFGAAGKQVGYSCPGTCIDYAYAKLKTPFAFAFEIYASPSNDADLRSRWQASLNAGGAELIQQGHHLGHPHFREVFSKQVSDFVGEKSLNLGRQVRTSSKQSSMDFEAGMDGVLTQTKDDDMDCFAIFNPGTQGDYDKAVINWAEAYIQMSNMIVQRIVQGKMPPKNGTVPVQ